MPQNKKNPPMYVSADSTQMFTKNPSHPFKRHCFTNYRLYLYRVSSVSHTPWATLLECWYIEGKQCAILCLAVQSPAVNHCLLYFSSFIHEYLSYKNNATCSNAQLKLKSPNIVLLCKQVLRDCLTIRNKDYITVILQ